MGVLGGSERANGRIDEAERSRKEERQARAHRKALYDELVSSERSFLASFDEALGTYLSPVARFSLLPQGDIYFGAKTL